MRTKHLVLAALISGVGIFALRFAFDHPAFYESPRPYPAEPGRAGLAFTRFSGEGPGSPEAADRGHPNSNFIDAASAAIGATVHLIIKNQHGGTRSESFALPGSGSGSGVLISQDGYLITNNHVIQGGGEIRVTLSNKRVFRAKLIGADPASDLAVLKIDGKGLPFLLYGDSEELKPGQWVLAIGYPLELETTVTAGIISTKNSFRDSPSRLRPAGLHSFIQTDAVINHGNSGGPLVNTRGQLVGINSYFASLTGAYTGYSFAIPVNTVKKVVDDLMNRPS